MAQPPVETKRSNKELLDGGEQHQEARTAATGTAAAAAALLGASFMIRTLCPGPPEPQWGQCAGVVPLPVAPGDIGAMQAAGLTCLPVASFLPV